MKKLIRNILITIMKFLLNIIYFFMKMSKVKNKVIFISRQSDYPSLDFKLLKNEILKYDNNIKVEMFCKKIERGIFNKIKYSLYMLKVMKNLADSKICIIEGYAIPVSMLKQRKELVVIQIWHALGAIKKFGYQTLGKLEGRDEKLAKIMCMHKNYTYVLAPSNKTKQFYKEAFNIKEEQILVMGMPRIDYLLQENKEIKENIIKEYPQIQDKLNILYVPTFRKGKKIKFDIISKNVNKDKFNLIIKKHPLEEIEEQVGCIVDNKFKSIDWLDIADFVITDYSAIAFEAIIKNKPTYFYLYDIEEYKKNRGINIDLFTEMPNATSANIKDILYKIENDQYNYEQLEKFKNEYIQTINKNNTINLAKFALDKANQNKK